MKRIIEIIDRCIHPKNFRDPILLARCRVLIGMDFLGIFAFAFLSLFIFDSFPPITWIAWLALLGAPFILRFTGNIVLSAFLVIMLILAVNISFYVDQVQEFGIFNPQVLWTCLILTGGSLVGGIKLVIPATIITLISYNVIATNYIDSLTTGKKSTNLVHLIEFNLALMLMMACVSLFEFVILKLAKRSTDALQALETQKLKTIEIAKLSSLGEMAGGIAHEVNNPLAVILGNVNIIQKILDANNPEQPAVIAVRLFKITEMVDRIRGIITSLGRLSHVSQQDNYSIAALRDIVEDVTRIYDMKLKSLGYRWIIEIDPAIHIYCNTISIGQILINITSNAIEALEKDTCDEGWIAIRAHRYQNQVFVRCSNSAPPMDRELASRITDPFFTADGLSQGKGLGLSISQTIAGQHSGKLELDFESKETCFVLTLPDYTHEVPLRIRKIA
ncbi:MAG: GHKL domain-containing protein [Pseudobacteriovorax sp.]|nr:GHKL domain-containing protein [Pseudobacteriovorax sp.]